jgi:pilus assembly protein CpaF
MIPRRVHEEILRKHLAPLVPLLDDPTVTEVLVNGPEVVWVERRGKLVPVEVRFESSRALDAALRALAQFVGRSVGPERPILEGRLPDGSRVEAIFPPAAPDGPAIAIRRFAKCTLTMESLVETGSLPSPAADLLGTLVRGRQNIVVSGGTGSGKTSLLNALAGYVPANERIVVIEDASELQLQHAHVVRLEAQPPDANGRGAISIRDLFRASLRMRPDRIVVGEIRDGAAFELVQAMTSGHGGCLTTVHASHALDALRRIESLALGSDIDVPLAALRAQIASAVDVVVQTARLHDGTRRVSQIAQVTAVEGEAGYRVVELFALRRVGVGKNLELCPTGAELSTAGWVEVSEHGSRSEVVQQEALS